ncbi:Cu2+-binding oxygen sensor (SCO1/SenC/PrrC family) [Methylacidimicrobium sp. AP8]|uniref:SCO family protein n=1 Tax=Methylacidimicrobium sp. AP8 TaxID=2730359 RepID=UPI0018C10356|nr:SCO family protein [Methylacidimicrobium sp. AP8]CAB4244435.1 Cu2+-binding oxygen sensor (SCO1/SenC/PrrC family) [Methylacidimicrobium sp. AP8]
MSEKGTRRIGLIPFGLATVVLLSLFLTLTYQALFHRKEGAARLPVLRRVETFSLTDQSKKTVTLGDLRGKVWVADFIYTSCPGPCPAETLRMKEIQDLVAGLPDVRLVSFSVDPGVDTPEVLARYAQAHGADPAKWYFLTGTVKEIWRLATESFALAVGENPPNRPAEEGPVFHSTQFALVDQEGRIRAYYDGLRPATAARVARDIRALLEERPTAGPERSPVPTGGGAR